MAHALRFVRVVMSPNTGRPAQHSALRDDGVLILAGFTIEYALWRAETTLRWGGQLPLALVLGTTLCAYCFLLVRRERPWLAYGAIWAHSTLSVVLMSGYIPFVALLIMVYTLARWRPRHQALLALFLTLVPFSVSSYDAWAQGSRRYGYWDLIVPFVLWFLLAAGVWAAGRSLRRFEAQAARDARAQAEEAAQALVDERARLARELHDIVGHSVSAMILQAAGAKALASRTGGPESDPRVISTLGVIETSGAAAMRELHRLLGLLRSEQSAIKDTSGFPTASDRPSLSDISHLVETARDAGQGVTVHSSGTPVRLDESVDLAAYRVVQESLSNAMKHAGRDGLVDIIIRWCEDKLELRIRSARGFRSESDPPVNSGGFGLLGLRERVELVGGTFQSGPADGDFLTVATFPLEQAAP